MRTSGVRSRWAHGSLPLTHMTTHAHGLSGLSGMHFPTWLGVALTLVLFGLVVVFHEVVRGAVEQGDTRRRATAMHAEAVWRCKALRGSRMQGDCLLRLNSAPPAVVVKSSNDPPIAPF